jgi:hypothetical protein
VIVESFIMIEFWHSCLGIALHCRGVICEMHSVGWTKVLVCSFYPASNKSTYLDLIRAS